MEERGFRLGMNLKEKEDQIPKEFKQLAKDFADKGFITTSLDNLVNWARTGSRKIFVRSCKINERSSWNID